MKWSLIPIPTNYAKELQQLPQSILPTEQTSRKPPKERSSVIPDELDCFQKSDTVKTLDDLNETTTPAGFQFKRNFAIGNHNELLEEITQRQFCKPKGRPPYSAAMIRYALHLRYTSFQASKQLLDRFPLQSISLLNKIQQGGVDSVKTLKILHEQGNISKDCVLMVDEMYLQKAKQYHSGEYVGEDEDGNLYKGIVAFMIVGLKELIPYIVQAVPEVTFYGEWLAKKKASSIDDLTSMFPRCSYR